MYDISTNRECFFGDRLVDTYRTTAESLLHHPIRNGIVMKHDAPWEGDGCDFHNFFYDGGIYRMYYLGWKTDDTDNIVVCYAESKDGIDWNKPKLGFHKWNNSYDNNILMDRSRFFNSVIDNFMVFKDINPDCSNEKRYKAVARIEKDGQPGLHSYYSADGLHFTYGEVLSTEGLFDSLNVAFWDEVAICYRCYFRGFHKSGSADVGKSSEENIRDIRCMESDNFITWTKPKLLDFGASEDISLYTNVVQPYPRAKNILVGFPSRYIYRRQWNGSFEELCGRDNRRKRMKTEPRFGLVLTDCAFITSYDGYHFKKYDEAFMRPEAEHPSGWIYGDCYPARGFVQTPSDIEGAASELSMYVPENHMTGLPVHLVRYTIRCDGFVSMHAGAKEKMLVTKPFTYEGGRLFVNFETSAVGYMYFTLTDETGKRYDSCETFGNSTNRLIVFDDGVVESLSKKPVTLEVRMRDADLYSIKFE